MTGWVPLTVATATEAMPTDYAVAYAAWLDANPMKSARLASIVAATVSAFRSAVRAQVGYDPDSDPTTVPDQALHHAENLVLFKLGMEMGIPFEPQVYNLYNQANIWLRMVASGAIKIEVGDVVGTPSYEAPEGERCLS